MSNTSACFLSSGWSYEFPMQRASCLNGVCATLQRTKAIHLNRLKCHFSNLCEYLSNFHQHVSTVYLTRRELYEFQLIDFHTRTVEFIMFNNFACNFRFEVNCKTIQRLVNLKQRSTVDKSDISFSTHIVLWKLVYTAKSINQLNVGGNM